MVDQLKYVTETEVSDLMIAMHRIRYSRNLLRRSLYTTKYLIRNLQVARDALCRAKCVPERHVRFCKQASEALQKVCQ